MGGDDGQVSDGIADSAEEDDCVADEGRERARRAGLLCSDAPRMPGRRGRTGIRGVSRQQDGQHIWYKAISGARGVLRIVVRIVGSGCCRCRLVVGRSSDEH